MAFVKKKKKKKKKKKRLKWPQEELGCVGCSPNYYCRGFSASTTPGRSI